VWRQAAVPAALIASALIVGCQDRVTQPRGATNYAGIPAHDATPPAPVVVYFHGTGNNANPPTLSLNTTAPTGTTAKYRDSPSINFNNGNVWQSAGTWLGAASLTTTTISSLGDVHLWLGLKNSDDVGARFDVRVEAYKNGTLFASGETRCVQSLASGANNAKEVVVAFDAFTAMTFNGSSDVLSIKQLTRVGTNATGGLCGGHSNAVGIRSYFDASNRATTFTLVPPGPTSIVLTVMTNGHVDGIVDTSLAYTAGATVPYAVTPQSGFPSVIVFVDSVAAPANGTIVMDRSHHVLAVALTDTTRPAADPALVARLRSLLTSPTPVASYQSYVNDMITLSRQIGSAAAESSIAAATINAFSAADTVALRVLGAALDGQEFTFPGTPSPVTTPWPAGDTIPNGYPFNMAAAALRAPALRASARARAPSFRPANVGGPSGPVDPRPVDIVTINGWNTNEDDSWKNLFALEELARSSSLFATAPTANFSIVYNDNHFSLGATPFRLACLHRTYPDAFEHVPGVITAVVASIPCSDAQRDAFLVGAGDQVTQALLQLRDIIAGDPPSVSNATLAKVKAKMENARSGQNHVIFVPHSQGNLYAIQALAAVTSAGAAPTDADSACVGWVPTASPTSVGYPPIGSARMSPVQLQGDIILGRPDPVPYPKFPATATPLSDSVLAAQQARGTNPGFRFRNFFRAKKDSIFLHSFRSAYLAPDGGRQLVLNALTSVYSFCEPVLTLDAPTFPMSPGDSSTATVSIAGADGRPMTFTAPVRWSTSDSTVARVDQAGHLTAVEGGDARISVRYRGKVVDAIVSVISTSPSDIELEVHNTAVDFQAPFQFVGWGIMRRRTVVARATMIDSTANVMWMEVYGQDLYGRHYRIQNHPTYDPGGRTFTVTTEFFDNPHNADGTPSPFASRNGGYFIMKPEVLVHVAISNGVARWYRVPLQ
jgi:hypothetical protein